MSSWRWTASPSLTKGWALGKALPRQEILFPLLKRAKALHDVAKCHEAIMATPLKER